MSSILSTHVLDRVRAHHDSGFYLKTPEYRWVLENVGAVSWGWPKSERAAGSLSPAECAATNALNAERRHGSGRNQRRRSGGSRSALAKDRPRDPGHLNIAHFKICQMPLPVGRATLSPRQREVLDWIADCKTLQDISILTGLSLSTVEKHFRSTRDTLEAETTAQAIAKAAFLNQMFASQSPPNFACDTP